MKKLFQKFKDALVDDAKRLGLLAGMEPGVGAEEGMDGVFSVRAES